jgi:hypothetical protein
MRFPSGAANMSPFLLATTGFIIFVILKTDEITPFFFIW